MRIALLISLCALAAWPALADEISPDEWLIERKELTQAINPSTWVQVSNPHGDIRVRSHGKQEIYILVNAQRHRDDPLKYELEICECEQMLEIAATVEPHAPNVREDFKKRRMDMTVFLPRSTGVHLQTERGFIESRGLAGELEITSEWGNVRTRHAGPVAIHTTFGAVEALLLDTRWPRNGSIETKTGAIDVRIARDGNLDVTMESAGLMTSDYSTEVDFDEQTGYKTATAVLGKGGRDLLLKSSRGSISILRLEIEQPD